MSAALPLAAWIVPPGVRLCDIGRDVRPERSEDHPAGELRRPGRTLRFDRAPPPKSSDEADERRPGTLEREEGARGAFRGSASAAAPSAFAEGEGDRERAAPLERPTAMARGIAPKGGASENEKASLHRMLPARSPVLHPRGPQRMAPGRRSGYRRAEPESSSLPITRRAAIRRRDSGDGRRARSVRNRPTCAPMRGDRSDRFGLRRASPLLGASKDFRGTSRG